MGRAGTGPLQAPPALPSLQAPPILTPLQAPPALTDPFIMGDRRFLSPASRINISLMTLIFTKTPALAFKCLKYFEFYLNMYRQVQTNLFRGI